MRHTCALVLIAALICSDCAARGAATAKVTPSPAAGRSQDPPDLWHRYAAELPIGSVVRVGTTNGEHFSASLLIVDDTGITVKPATRVSEPIRHITFDSLEQLELQSGDGPASRAAQVGVGVATGAGVFFGGLLLIFLATYRD